jgi:outer membrane protein assembly factor BamD
VTFHLRVRTPVLIAGALGLALSACAHKNKAKTDLSYQERPVELIYATGAQKLDQRLWSEAAQYFDEVERQHPYSEWARRSILMEAYAYYESNKYDDAISAADRFVSLYPGNPSAPYAYYLKAVCYWEQIADVTRDQGDTLQALNAFREVEKRYPTSEYAVDAKLKIDMIQDQLAGKEMTVGRWYLRQGMPIAAIGRFKTVLDKYQTTSHAPEALYRLVEAYLTLGLRDEAVRDGAVLGYNYPGDHWYGQAYALLTSRGLKPSAPPKPKPKGQLTRLGKA